MITLARILTRYEYDADPAELPRIADAAFRVAESATDEILPLDEFGIDATVHTGSTNVVVIVFAALQTVVSALVLYGGGAEGLDRLKVDLRKLRDRIARQVPREAEIPSSVIGSTRLTTTGLRKLERLIASVRCGEIAPRVATDAAIKTLADAGEPSDPRAYRELTSLFSNIEVRRNDREELASSPDDVGARRAQPRQIGPPATPALYTEGRRATEHLPVKKAAGVRIWRNPGESERHTEEF